MTTRPITRGQLVLATLFGLLALNAAVQVGIHLLGDGSDDAAMAFLQALVALTGAAAMRGSWTGARWAPAAALTYGAVTTGMLLALGPLLDLEPEAVRGIRIGAAAVLLFSVGAASHLRRLRTRREAARVEMPAA